MVRNYPKLSETVNTVKNGQQSQYNQKWSKLKKKTVKNNQIRSKKSMLSKMVIAVKNDGLNGQNWSKTVKNCQNRSKSVNMDKNGHYGQKLSKTVKNGQNSQKRSNTVKTSQFYLKWSIRLKTIKNGQKWFRWSKTVTNCQKL